MKTKGIFVLVGIAVCTLILSALAFPAILTGVSADTDAWTLEIYGNANEDDCIDMRDYTYAARIICWLEDETTFADANYDGRISVADMTQIGLIILGRDSELTVIDGRGREVTVNKPVERIAAAYCSAECEMLRTLKVMGKVVGVPYEVTQDTVFFPELSKLPTYGWAWEMDYEALLALNPDFVITATYDMDWVDQLLQVCQEAGIPVVCFSYLDGKELVPDYTLKLGYALDREEEAKEFIDFVQHSTDEIEEKVKDIPEDDKPKVYIESLLDKWKVAPPMSPPGRVCALAGGRNIFTDTSYDLCGPQVEAEWVVEQNPDVIIRMGGLGGTYFDVASGYGADDPSDMKALRDEIMNRPELANVEAVKTGQVYVLSCTAVISPTYCIGVPYMAKAFYPDLFSYLDVNEIHQQYLTEFQRLDYDLDEHGVFIYHPVYFPEGR